MTDHQTTPPADAPERMEFNVPPFYDTPTAYVRLDLYDAQAARIAELEAALASKDDIGVLATSGAEQNWIDHMESACPSCGGSGHIDDHEATTPKD